MQLFRALLLVAFAWGVSIAPAAAQVTLDNHAVTHERCVGLSSGEIACDDMAPTFKISAMDPYFQETVHMSGGRAYVWRFINPNGVVTEHEGPEFDTPDCPDLYQVNYWVSGVMHWYCWPTVDQTYSHWVHFPGAWRFELLVDSVVMHRATINAMAGTIRKLSGDNQQGFIGEALPSPIKFDVRDFEGNPPWTFNDIAAISISGPGSDSTADPGTIEFSEAEVGSSRITLGSAVGTYTISVSVGDAASAVFTAIAKDHVTPPDNTGVEEGVGGPDPNAENPLLKGGSGSGCDGYVGDPIAVGIGNSVQTDVDYAQTGLSPIEFVRVYNSMGSPSRVTGNYWTTTYDRYVIVPVTPSQPARLRRPDGKTISFYPQAGGIYKPASYAHGTLTKTGSTWRYVDEQNTTEDFDSLGKLLTITDRQGRVQTATYDRNGRLSKITSNAGGQLTFAYDTFNQLATLTDQTGRVWRYAYSGNSNLRYVTRPDGQVPTYCYTDPYNPYLLTRRSLDSAIGDDDCSTSRQAMWTYDAEGRATSSYFEGTAEEEYKHRLVEVTYAADGAREVKDPNGNVTSYATHTVNGKGFVDSITGPGFASCGLGDLVRQYDASSNVTSVTQFGRKTSYGSYDNKGQFAYQIEADETSSARRTEYLYDARFWNRPTRITEPSVVPGKTRVTQLTYDAKGNVTQASVSGFRPNGTPDGVPISRSTTYQFNGPYGQLSQIDGPRSDVADVTTFTYGASSRLIRVTDPNSVVLRNNIAYTATGQVASEDRPNGLRLVYAYDAKTDLLTSLTESKFGVTLRKTTWTYDRFLRVASTTYSDTKNTDLTVSFEYNMAGEISRTLVGNKAIIFDRDRAGNVKQKIEQNHWVAAAFDAYDRVDRVINPNNSVDYDYHPDGTLTKVADGRNLATDYTYDALKRLTRVQRPGAAETSYQYDVHDRLIQVTDANQGVTTYTYDDLGNKISQTSPDTGTTSFTHDNAGNLISATDAKGQLTTYTYDAGGRLKTVDRASTIYDETYAYDTCLNGTGLVCSIANTAGETVAFEYDEFGRATKQTNNGRVVSYQYDAGGNVVAITYPSGRRVSYDRNAAGQTTRVQVRDGNFDRVLARDITYSGLGPAVSWTLGNSLVAKRTYDAQRWPTAFQTQLVFPGHPPVDLYSINYTGFDGNGNITSMSIDGSGATFGYDEQDRLQSASGSFGTRDYQYDPVGNRTSLDWNSALRIYQYEPNSNRIDSETGFEYTLDPNGNTLSKLGVGGSGQTFSYSPHNRLIAVYDATVPMVPVATYRYNALGQRVAKTVGPVETRFAYGLSGELLAETDTTGKVLQEYVYLNGAPLALLGAPTTLPPPQSVDIVTDNKSSQEFWALKKDNAATNGSYFYMDSRKLTAGVYTATNWQFSVPADGYYDVYTHWMRPAGNGTTTVSYSIGKGDGGPGVGFTVPVAGQVKGSWVKLGQAYLTAGAWSIGASGSTGGQNVDLHEDSVRVVLASVPPTQELGYQYVLSDHLGTPWATVDSSRRLTWRANYDPFGLATVNEDPDADGQSVKLNLRFPGQYFDGESALHYNYFRDYDPNSGRYMQSDPMGIAGGMNTYLYADANPTSKFDPTGQFAIVSVDGNNVYINVPILYVEGFRLTKNYAETKLNIDSAIEGAWTGQFGKYNVKTRVTHPFLPLFEHNRVLVQPGTGRSDCSATNVNRTCQCFETPWKPRTYAHEGGHLMGLVDKYDHDTGAIEPGYENNIMANSTDGVPSEADIEFIINLWSDK